LALDLATKIPGLPRGKIVEYYGLESSGKSTLALRAVAEAQARGEYCAWVDAEQCMEPIWARRHGVIMDPPGTVKKHPYALYMCYPDWGEQAIEAIDTLAKTNKFALIVVDSVAALISKAEYESPIDKATVGRQSQMMSTSLRRIAAVLNNSRTTVIFINQLREKIGVMYGNKYTTPGGLALKFYSSVRVEFWRKNLKEGDEVVGNEITVKVVKNKVRAPFGTGTIYLRRQTGIDDIAELANLAVVEYGVVQTEGRKYFFKDQELAMGMEKFMELLRSNAVLRDALKAELLKTMEPIPEPVEVSK
jgi:recombination protein RecA